MEELYDIMINKFAIYIGFIIQINKFNNQFNKYNN